MKQRITGSICRFAILLLLQGLCLCVWGQKNITKPNVPGPNGVSVNTYTGALFYQRQDIFIPARGINLDFTFSYNSISRDRDWGLGLGWTFSYNMAYAFDSTDIVIEHKDGSRRRYLPNGQGGWYCPAGVFDSLEQYQPNMFRLTEKSGMKYFFDNPVHGKLTKIQDRNGNTVTLTYTDTLLTSVTDATGRAVQLNWSNGRLISIHDPNSTPARTIQYTYDQLGRPVRMTDAMGFQEKYTYDDTHKMSSLTNKNGNPLTIKYTHMDAVHELISCVGKQTFSYNYGVRKTYHVESVGGENQITIFQYNDLGQLVEQSGNCCGSNVKYEYDMKNNVTKRTDANGNATTYTYDPHGNVLTETDPLGNTMSWTYEHTYNQMLTATDREGHVTTYGYDGNGNMTSVSLPLGLSESFTYDPYGYPLTYTDRRGFVTTYTYNAHWDIQTVTNQELEVFHYIHDGVGNLITATDANLHTTHFKYDLNNRQTKITNALGDSVIYTYDQAGNLVAHRDRNGNVTSLTYDGLNRLLTRTDALGNVHTYTYDERGNVLSMTDPNGDAEFFAYDKLNRLTSRTSPVGDLTQYGYDGVGNLTTIILPGQNVVNVVYDQLNRMESISDAIGTILVHTYDRNSNKRTLTDATGLTTTNQYDALNRLIAVIDPSGGTVTYQYDGNNNRIKETNQKGQMTTMTYDKANRRISVTNPLMHTTYFGYDNVGNLTTYTDGEGHVTTYTYDAAYRRTGEAYDNGDTRTYVFDPVGNLIERTEPDLTSIELIYDAANRLTRRTYSGGGSDSIAYDPAGRLIRAINEHATVELDYDGADRLISESINGVVTAYQYHTAQRTRQIQYPSGDAVSEYYDVRGRLAELVETAIPGNLIASYTYDGANRLLQKNYLNNTSSAYTYDARSNVTALDLDLTNPVAYQFGYDQTNNMLYKKNTTFSTESNQFIYDQFDRLTQFKKGVLSGVMIPSPLENILYTYDPTHNRATVNDNGSLSTYTSNNLNQYTAITGSMGFTPAYDANGNMTYDGVHTYGYDAESRIDSVDGGATAIYQYDALGRRIAKITPTDTTKYFYDGIRVIEERNGSDDVLATYTYGLSDEDVVRMRRGGEDYYYYSNTIGSVTHIADASGDLVEYYDYDAYGNLSVYNASGTLIAGTTIGNPYFFTGQRYDAETGLYHYKSRYYSPALGRFMQRDPTRYVDGPNLYEYTYSNPSNWIDPLGLGGPCDKPWWETGLDWLQTGLDLAGLIPGVGEIADGINAGIYAARGDWVNAGLSAAAMIPFAGWAATGAKFADNAVDAARWADNAVDASRAGDEMVDVYRVYGGESGPIGRSWTPVNPATVDNYRDAAGLPNGNTGRFVVEGQVPRSAITEVRPALPLDGNRGGLTEYVIGDPSRVNVTRVSGVNPEF